MSDSQQKCTERDHSAAIIFGTFSVPFRRFSKPEVVVVVYHGPSIWFNTALWVEVSSIDNSLSAGNQGPYWTTA